jgi:arylsulfatase A-like enzyme
MKVRSLSWLIILTLCHALLPNGEAAESQRPNLVFFMADDWSFPHAGILGDPVVRTPHFDRVAREGILFENAFVSTPSCTPSRLSVLTGQHHWRLKEGDSLVSCNT